jgi:hypothetical protein
MKKKSNINLVKPFKNFLITQERRVSFKRLTDGSNDKFLLFTHPQHLDKNIVKDYLFAKAYLGLVVLLEFFGDFYLFELDERFGLEHDTVELDFKAA